MPLPYPYRRAQKAWYSSKPLQRSLILAIAFITLYLFLHSSSSRFNGLLADGNKEDLLSSCAVPVTSDLVSSINLNRSPKPRAAFVILVRERQLGEVLPSIRDLHWSFNDDPEHGYDFVFLSETPFTSWFKDHINRFLSQTRTQPKASYGLISKEHWDVPSHIDLEKAKKRWAAHMSGAIPYGKSTSYRQMCRYMSGPIFQHPLLKDLDYYWRIEPETKHLCTYRSHWKQVNGKREWIERDPFRFMRDNKKKYAWIMTMSEYRSTVMSLMATTNKWRKENPSYLAKNDSLSFISDDGKGYNLCHYWSNFEIIDLSFTRSPAYTSYFESLDKAGGFFYERWGDAPVRSIAASLILNNTEVWQIDYAGYFHPPITKCPRQLDPGQVCACDPQDNSDYSFSFVGCRSKVDKINGVDTRAVVRAINKQSGVLETFKEDELPYAIPPPRLMTSPIF